MADVQQQLLSTNNDANHPTPLASNASSLPTPALEDRPPKRRASLSPIEKQIAAATAGAKNMDAQKKARNNASSYKGSNANSRGSVMTMPGMIGGEITYTPTTHRISKAKKGKKVHACEFPGCTKIFTRAEHRKRHEANHNTSPAFQCQVEGCKKPFQRADLLTRHMERQHNMPADPSTRSQYSRSAHSASPCMSHIGAAHMRQAPSSTPSSMPQTGGAMSIGSIIEPNHFHSNAYRSHSLPLGDISDMSSEPIGTGPRSLHQDMLYGLTSSGDSPLYSSSDSCYSPLSDYLQPQAPMGPYYGQEIQRPATVSVESSYQPLVNSPMTHSPASMGPATPSWGQTFDPVTLGFVNDAPYVPSVCPSDETEDMPEYQTYDVEQHRQYQYSSPTWTNATTIPQYEMAMPQNQQWPWTKVSY